MEERQILKGVDVSETDFLWGLAEALGANTSEAYQAHSHWARMRACVKACLDALDRIDRGELTGEPGTKQSTH
jgi:hypothetical protein